MTNRFTFAQGIRFSIGLLLGASAPAALAQADDDPDGGGMVSRPVVQSTAPSASRELNAALARLAADPRNVPALFDAAEAALRLGDSDAAIGFVTRANEVQPNNPRAGVVMGRAYLVGEDPVSAIRAFDEAERAGGDTFAMASDRGLAYDLVGDNARAQRWYQVALSRGADDEVTRRYALSLAISGDRRAAEALLAPLIQRQDRPTWRTRTFVMAVTGGPDEAVAIAYATMPQELAAGIAPYLRYMPRLTTAQQAAAANLGRFPRAADIGRDDPRIVQYAALNPRAPRTAEAGLIPSGAPLGPGVAASTDKASRERRRRPGRDDKKLAAATPVAKPVSVTVTPIAPQPAAALPPAAARPAAPSSPQVASAAAASVPQPASAAPRPTVLSALDLPPGAPRPAVPPIRATTPATVSRPSATPPVPAREVAARPVPATTVAPPAASSAPVSASPVPASAVARPGSFDLARVGGSAQVAAAAPVQAAAPVPPASSASNASASLAPVALPPSQPAQVAAATVPPPAAPAPVAAAAAPQRPADFASLFKSFTPPAEERTADRPAVDITRLPPKPAPKPVKPDTRGERPDGPTDVSRTSAKDAEKPSPKDLKAGLKDTKAAPKDAKAGAKDAKAAAKDAKAKKAEPSHPSRIWVQVLTGANKDVMDNEWRRIVKEAPEVLRGRKPFLSPWRNNFRLLTGPFESEAAAQEFIGKLRKSGVSSYQWTSPAGQPVDTLALK